MNDYWARIQDLEYQRPSAFGDRSQCRRVQRYREDVARLSLGVLTTTAFRLASTDEGVSAVQTDDDLRILFRIVMQCQIIDDIMDFANDSAKRLPGFLTASESLLESFERTYHAACCYADNQSLPQTGNLFPLRIALFSVSAISKLLITLGRWRQRIPFIQPLPEHVLEP